MLKQRSKSRLAGSRDQERERVVTVEGAYEQSHRQGHLRLLDWMQESGALNVSEQKKDVIKCKHCYRQCRTVVKKTMHEEKSCVFCPGSRFGHGRGQ